MWNSHISVVCIMLNHACAYQYLVTKWKFFENPTMSSDIHQKVLNENLYTPRLKICMSKLAAIFMLWCLFESWVVEIQVKMITLLEKHEAWFFQNSHAVIFVTIFPIGNQLKVGEEYICKTLTYNSFAQLKTCKAKNSRIKTSWSKILHHYSLIPIQILYIVPDHLHLD